MNMKRTATTLVSIGFAAALTFSAHAASVSLLPTDPLFTLTGTSDGAGLPGAPGGKGGAAGSVGASKRAGAASDNAGQIFAYCASVLDDLQRRNAVKPGPYGIGPAECAVMFPIPAESGQPGRGGNGGGFAGLPGGSGGRAGSAQTYPVAAPDQLITYCSDLLRQLRRGPRDLPPLQEPRNSDLFEPSDCADYFATLDGARPDAGAGIGFTKRNGADGPSISGGIGGRGGRAGVGPGGGSGGGGGAGVAGGIGGRGGAGGASD